jgi:hypothetical protein
MGNQRALHVSGRAGVGRDLSCAGLRHREPDHRGIPVQGACLVAWWGPLARRGFQVSHDGEATLHQSSRERRAWKTISGARVLICRPRQGLVGLCVCTVHYVLASTDRYRC